MDNNRIFFIDNLRTFVVFLVVVLHVSLSYTAYSPPGWYVHDPQTSPLFSALVYLIDVPIMQIMFFVAGYCALGSLARRGTGRFLKEKCIRIGLPWVFGVLVITPLFAYVSRQVPGSLIQFWTKDFLGARFGQGVYWFLGVLMFQFVLLAALYFVSARFRGWEKKVAVPSWLLFAGFWVVMTACFLLINQFFAMDDWYKRLYVLVFQPLRAPLYCGYFMLGVYASQKGWFTATGYRPGWSWVGMLVLSGAVYLRCPFIIPGTWPLMMLQAVSAMLFNLYCLSALMAGITIFQRCANSSGRLWSSQARNSYGIYYIHLLFLYPLTYVFLSITISVYLKALIVIILGWLLSWGFSTLVLTKVPGLRRMF